MLVLVAELFLLAALLIICLAYFVFFVPPRYPTNIPAVPFWVALIPFFKDVDQSEIFREYIERPLRTHGAVKLFFGAQWNILVHKPSYLAAIFKDEDIYQKSGNQKKIPHSVLAHLLGDNIISSHGERWRNYRSVVKPGLQRDFEARAIARNAEHLCGLLRDAQVRAGNGGVPVQELLQRYSVANCSEVVLQIKLDALTSANAPINSLQTEVKREIFKPIFMNFPVLDRFPFPSRTRARRTVDRFKHELRRALVESHAEEDAMSVSAASSDGLGRRMLDARESGLWDEKQLLDNLTVAFVAGQENPQLCMISTLYLMAKHPESQAKLYAEAQSKGLLGRTSPDPDPDPDPEILQDMPYLTSLIYESLRLFPPIGQLVNRKASKDVLLGDGIVIPKGTYLGYNCYSTNRDPAVWGPRADEFDPARWGDSPLAIRRQYRLRKAKAEFISFHGGRRACLGEKFAMLEMRVTLVALVREFRWMLDPAWVDRKTPLRTMDFSNEGQSFYHRLQGAFVTDGNGRLMHCTGPQRQWAPDNRGLSLGDSGDVRIYQDCDARQHRTVILVNSARSDHADIALDEFFVQLVLHQADFSVRSRPLKTADNDPRAEQIVDLFDSYLRYQGKDDKWVDGGRTYFTERVRHFTAQERPIEFCLPAFPCKSSNRDKVTGPDPDRGEELALERLHDFVEAVERIYGPGAKLWIISDGHVFSDCIGVDDADVDAYGEKLKQMNHAIGVRRGNTNRVGFKSLVDLFRLSTSAGDGGLPALAQRLSLLPSIDHHVSTKLTEEAELCRRLLMAGCGPRRSAVRAKIDSKDPAITALYRGFSRFMLEDLEHHPYTRNLTRSQQKKLSAKVAFEMILRNQAYSNLVEMLFPNHVRLSIHAHNNAGPKFGIQLFDPSRVRAVQTLSADGELMTSLDLLHIPTPWHNSVVQLAGSDVILVTKAKLARAALASGSMTGGLVGAEEGRAHFMLEKKKSAGAAIPAPVAPPTLPPASSVATTPAEGVVETESEMAPAATETATDSTTAAVELPRAANRPTAGKPRKPTTTFAEKADDVVRRSTGSSVGGEKSSPASHATNSSSWLAKLRWVLSLFGRKSREMVGRHLRLGT
ncbi:Pyoverdine/dityrosine biosynthesis protein-domain-containing protein [Thermothelomyces heterothallicus CBS 202.75]|uniref:Pyoverdine/dityrosine biosynthesis protein-domain-containing protein n=1 Tax=Thermothelomyces heterothallicus CBS 202.75 TaxID=1149848 RepID=UPI0037426F63